MTCMPRNVIAICWFKAGPGRAAEAAEAWAFELTHYFKRGVGERPDVTYNPLTQVYECRGLMTTTHPFDPEGVVKFDFLSEPWSLDFAVDPVRRARIRALPQGERWDGRDSYCQEGNLT